MPARWSTPCLALLAVTTIAGASAPPAFPVVFFPPDPPVYGDPVESQSSRTRWRFSGQLLTPPDGLADFVGETFYPPLSTRLQAGKLDRALETRIEQYRARRDALVNELLNHCLLLEAEAEESREEGFRDFSARQSPHLAALEAEAEELRRDLARSGWWMTVDWNDQRRWRLESFPPSRDWANREAEYQVVRAAAYYEDELIPAQRGLLRELAHDLGHQARKGRAEPERRNDSDAMFFSPETTRLRLPPELPPEVLAKIASFNREKAALKNQLRATLHEFEGASRQERAAAFARLAAEQWPRLGNLETLADEIRAALAPRFVPAPPAKAPPIPTWLVELIQPYNEDRDTYYADLAQAVRRAKERIPRPERSEDSDEQGRLEKEYAALCKAAERQATEEFQGANEARIADLVRRSQAIRKALETIAKTMTDPKTGRPLGVAALMQQHMAINDQFYAYGWASTLYTHYRTAMLQRGLSPEQRRLLFRYAVAGLAQPLPYGEPLPNRRATFPLPH